MEAERKEAILEEVLKWDSVPKRRDGDFTLEEYQERHKEKYGYAVPDTTARDRLDRRVEKGQLDTSIRYDVEEQEQRRVWWRVNGGEESV